MPTVQKTITHFACSLSRAPLARIRPANPTPTAVHAMASSSAPNAATAWPTCVPTMISTTPAQCSRTGQRRPAAGGGATSSQRGPAVNMKPAMKSGMNPPASSIPCSRVGGIAVVTVTPASGASSRPVHANADSSSISVPAKKPSRCGASRRCRVDRRGRGGAGGASSPPVGPGRGWIGIDLMASRCRNDGMPLASRSRTSSGPGPGLAAA